MIGAVALLLAFTAAVALAAVRPRAALLVTVFFAPWQGFDVDFGLRISAYQISVVAVTLVTAARSLYPGWRAQHVAAARLLTLFFVLALLWSLVKLPFLPQASFASGALRGPEIRAVLLIILTMLTMMPALLIGWTMNSIDDVRAMMRMYLISLVVLAVVGWIQLTIWNATGVNPLPIGIVSKWLGGADEAREGFFGFASLLINRMNSFAGEPRQLGGALIFGMLLIQTVMLTSREVAWLKLSALWLFFLVTAVFTYSSSAAALWFLGTFAQLTLPRLFGIRIQRSWLQLGSAVFAITLPIVLAVGLAEARGIPVLDVAADRTINRLDESGAIEDFDLAILDYFEAHPEALALGTGLGNAHLYAAPYILPEFLWYAEGNVFVAKRQYLRIISEVGLVGMALFLLWFGVLLIDALRAVRRPAGTPLVPIIAAGITTLIVYMATNSLVAEFWTVAGAMAVAVKATRTSARNPPLAQATLVPA